MSKTAKVAETAKATKPAKIESTELFTFVGYAVDKGGRGKLRYTNDKRRTRTLLRAGCTDVKFVELPKPMTKAEIDASEFIAQVKPTSAVEQAA